MTYDIKSVLSAWALMVFKFFHLVVIVSEHLDRVHNVVLIKCIFGSGKPQGVGILSKGTTWAK